MSSCWYVGRFLGKFGLGTDSAFETLVNLDFGIKLSFIIVLIISKLTYPNLSCQVSQDLTIFNTTGEEEKNAKLSLIDKSESSQTFSLKRLPDTNSFSIKIFSLPLFGS